MIKVTSGELLKYVKGVFDTEICLYVQQESLAEMKRIYNNLDTGRKVFAPHKKQNDESVLSNMHIVSLIFAAIVGFLIAIIMFVDIYKDAKTVIGGIIGGFFMAIFSFFVAAVFGWAIGLAIGFVVGIVRKIVEQKRINKQFEYDLIQYRQDLSDDDLRLVIEKKKKLALGKDIAEMENQIWTTRQNLQKMYSYDIIKPAYRNIVAVGTFYTYLATERTYSLTFDRNTGDQGAYNLYEQERRMTGGCETARADFEKMKLKPKIIFAARAQIMPTTLLFFKICHHPFKICLILTQIST